VPPRRPGTTVNPPPNRLARAFSLVELMIALAIISVLAALAVYGVTRYLASAKSSEAKQNVGAISRGATASFEREQAPSESVNEGNKSSAVSSRLCGTAVMVPLDVPKAKKYQPSTKNGEDYETGDAQTGWMCLHYQMTQPTYYQYAYTKDGSPIAPSNPAKCLAACYEAAARGDLNANGIHSVFARTGHINTASGKLKASSQVFVENEFE
jgi:type IV pilus assembly protein PilA